MRSSFAPATAATPSAASSYALPAPLMSHAGTSKKAFNQPVYKLMGGFRDRLPISANWALTPGPKDKIAKHLEDVLSRSFKAVKTLWRGGSRNGD